jgi:hypothetical protein
LETAKIIYLRYQQAAEKYYGSLSLKKLVFIHTAIILLDSAYHVYITAPNIVQQLVGNKLNRILFD